MKNVIEIKNLSLAYDDKTILNDVDLSIPANVRCAIIGPNGAGKSTLIKGVLGVIKAETGKVKIFEGSLDEHRRKISYVPQIGNVNWDFPTTVFDVVLMGRYQHLGLFKRPSKKDKEIAKSALIQMKMLDYRDAQISELSGGQKQRVFIARAIAQQADLYVLDEPLAGVDEITEKIVIEKFYSWQKEGKTVIAVHHDLTTLEDYFDYIVMLNKEIKVQGYTKDVLSKENISLAFAN